MADAVAVGFARFNACGVSWADARFNGCAVSKFQVSLANARFWFLVSEFHATLFLWADARF